MLNMQRDPQTGDIVLSNEWYTESFCVPYEDQELLRQALNIAANLEELSVLKTKEIAKRYIENE